MDAAGRRHFDAAADRIRDTAKWILASFAAIGGALIVGIQFSDIGSLTGIRLGGAFVALLLGFLSIIVAVRSVSRLMLPTYYWTMTTILEDPGRPVVERLERSPELLHPFGTVRALIDETNARSEHLTRARDAWRLAPSAPNERLLTYAREDFEEAAGALKRMLLWARHFAIEREYQRTVSRRLIPALGIASVGLVVFAYVIKEPATSAPVASLRDTVLAGVSLEGARLSGADLRGADLTGAVLDFADLSATQLDGADLSRASLVGTNLRGAVLDGAVLDEVVWSGTTCPDGVLSDQAAGSCAAHLTIADAQPEP